MSASGTLSNLTSGTSGLYFDETSGASGGADSNWTQTNSYTNTGLSENTQYTYKVKARNGNSTETSYTETASRYTFADTPTNLTATKPTNDNNKMNLTVDELPNAVSEQSGYYFYRANDEANHNSGWIQTNTWQDSNFLCNTNYTWYVKYRNGNGVETITVSVSSNNNYPKPGGGGLPPAPATTTGQVAFSPGQPATTIKYFDGQQDSKSSFTKVEIPAQATEGTTTINVEPRNSTQVSQNTSNVALPANREIIGNLVADYQASSGGQTVKEFKKPVTITFHYKEEDVKQYHEETLMIYYFDETNRKWISLADSQVNTITNTITATTTHFTLFAVMGEPKASSKIEPEQTRVEETEAEEGQPTEEGAEIPQALVPTQEETVELTEKQTYHFTQELRYGTQSPEVKRLQNLLKILNLFPQNIRSTGYFGTTTLKAVNRYQKEVMNINPCNCGVGPQTLAALNAQKVEVIPLPEERYVFTQDLIYNSRGQEVKELQTRLRTQGFFPHWVKSTGWFGSITEKAVKLFQKAHQLVEDGLFGPLTIEVLDK